MKNLKHPPIFLLKYCCAHVTVLAVFLFLYAGCALSPVKSFTILYGEQGDKIPEWPDNQCEKRFSQYWSNRFSGNIQGGYNMESPDFCEVVPLEKYKYYVQNAVKNKLLDMEIRQIQRESDFMIAIDCLARIQTEDGQLIEVSMMDRWVMTSGNWHHVIKDPLIFSL